MVTKSSSQSPPCPSCGQPLQQYRLPDLDCADGEVTVWGCVNCGETLPAAPPQEERP